MTTPLRPEVDCEQQHASFVVSDVAAAADFYTNKLGFSLAFTWGDPPAMAGVNLGNVQMFLEQGTPNPKGCSVYFVVGNADELYEFQLASGVEIVHPPTDQPYGLRDYQIRDLHGYTLVFGQHLFNEGPPIEIERVDVPVRLEKRLAALLHDLAAHKRMSLASCLEETLLHTLDGVAPHTKGQLKYIQALKLKHGIDYDSHGSYRFVEPAGAATSRRMPTNRSMPPGPVIPELPYADVRDAARWLCEAFGFTERLRIGGHRVQLHVGTGAIVVVEAGPGTSASGSRVMVPVADVDAHCANAKAAGANVTAGPATHPYGERQYSVLDLGGHRWTFTQSVADSDPATWGGELVNP